VSRALTGLSGLSGLHGSSLTQPSVITTMTVGVPGGQQPNLVVRDITNGWDLYTRNPDTVYDYAASCCKLMTILLAYENHSADWVAGTVTMNAQDVTQPLTGVGITLDSMGFASGDVITWQGAGYGLLLASSTECCRVIARTVGDALYVAAGSTGTQGETRFVERMNARAAELGMTNTTFENPYGASASGGVNRNRITARDLTTVCKAAFANSALRTIAQTPSFGIGVTGGRTTTLTAVNYNRFVNGPTNNQQSASDPAVKGGKNGVWTIPGESIFAYSLSQVWTSPAGYELVITTLGSKSLNCLMFDQRGLIAQLVKDFAYLTTGVSTGTDASLSSVKCLVGSDGSIVDESASARTMTATGVTVGTGVIAGSTGSASFAAVTNKLQAADSATLQVASSDATIEQWFSGTAGAVASEILFFCKADTGQREWLCEDFSGQLQIFASSDLANWNSSAVCLSMTADERATLYNGAPHHVALVRASGVWAMYLDGERFGNTVSIATTPDGTAPLMIGSYPSADVAWLGRIDDFRFTLGVARYTAQMVVVSPRKLPRS
jgi:D-alanyl-D-alanine carboxypeptidase